MLATSFLLLGAPLASAETRTLKLYYTHTRERAEITYKKNGRYIPSGLDKLNKFLRDWRRNEPTKMDPRLFDVIWETYRAVGARDYIHVVSAYRSPETNSMLRKRSSGVAKKSQHMLGKAMDFYIPGVKLSKLRAAALKAQGGGVGYYPRSGSPFVHLDVGNVRHWPRMSRSELLALFPDGKTIHLPTDGKPLPGYKQALAAYNARKKNGGAVQMASAPGGNFLARLFGGGVDDEEDSGEVALAAAARGRPGRPAVAVAAAEPVTQASAPVAEAVAPARPTPEAILAALPARAVPKPIFAPRPQVEVGAAPQVAGLDGFDTGSPAEAPAAQEVLIAANVPLPTRRPDVGPTVASAALQQDAPPSAAAAVAALTEAKTGSDAIAEILTGRQDAAAGESVASAAPIPGQRPDWKQVTAFAAPQPGDPAGAAQQELALAAQSASVALKGGRLMATAAAPASQRLALLSRPEGADPAAALRTGVRTTEKGARLSARNPKPEPKPVVVPVQQEIARWALQGGPVAQLRSAKAPSVAHAAIRTAPSAVYTSGFDNRLQIADARRFSGNAVTFLPVAKFASN